MEVSGQLHVPAALSPVTHWIGGWVGCGEERIPVAGNQTLALQAMYSNH
jgi:hypothetical protein